VKNCNSYQEQISAFIDGLLTENERLELMEHMAACPTCQACFDDQIALHDALTQLEAEAPAGLADQVMARVRETAQDKPEKKVISFPVWRRWATTAACCAIAVLGVLSLGGERSNTGDMHLPSTVSYSTVTAAEDSAAMDVTAVAEEARTEADSTTDDMILYAANNYMAEAKSAAAPATDTKLAETPERPLQDEAREQPGGCTLPGADKINPSIMMNGQVYCWAGMAFGELPVGFTYVAELHHIADDTLTEDGQFIALFEAQGQIYANPDSPDTVYVQMTTDWLDEEFVKFSLTE